MGTGVIGKKVGDEVFGFAPGCFGYSARVYADLMVVKPTNLSFTDAATTPTVYVTVYAAFNNCEAMDETTKVGKFKDYAIAQLLEACLCSIGPLANINQAVSRTCSFELQIVLRNDGIMSACAGT